MTHQFPIVKGLQSLFGENVTLIPLHLGTKKAKVKNWSKQTNESMKSGNYLQKLENSNIAILCGRASNHLVSLDFDSEEALHKFLELNPRFKEVPLSRGKRGGNLWFRMKGNYPSLTPLYNKEGQKIGEWRSDGGYTVVYGKHPDGMDYVIQNGVLLEISLDEIIWPEDWVLPWRKTPYQELVDKHGIPFEVTKTKKLVLNQMWVVGFYATEETILYEPDEGRFYSYDIHTGLWKRITEDAVKIIMAGKLKWIADEQGAPQIITLRTNSLLQALTELLKGHVEKREAFKKKIRIIHLANGMLDLSVTPPELKTFSPDFFSRNQCPVSMNEEADCPRFLNELLRSALNEEDVSLIQRWCGAVLLGINHAQRLLILTGTPGGGKSTFIEIIEKIIGLENVAQLRTNLLDERFELFGFIGKTFLTGKDVKGDFLNQSGASVIKALVGGDLLEAESKFGGRTQFRGEFNMCITCNSRLRVRLDGDVGAWRRRLLIVEYENPKPERPIPNFSDLLIQAEGAGILNWMIEGAILYLKDLDEVGSYRLTENQKIRVEALLAESDSVAEFVRECVVEDKASDVTTSELLQGYVRFCDEMGWESLSSRVIENQLPDIMLETFRLTKRKDVKRDGSAHRGYSGIRLKCR